MAFIVINYQQVTLHDEKSLKWKCLTLIADDTIFKYDFIRNSSNPKQNIPNKWFCDLLGDTFQYQDFWPNL